MEKEGLERVLNFLHHHELSVAVIVTDLHSQQMATRDTPGN